MSTIPIEKWRGPVVVAFALLISAFPFARATSALQGDAPSAAAEGAKWKTERSGENYVLTPADLPPGTEFTLTIEPPLVLRGADLTKWLEERSTREVAAVGTATDTLPTGKVQRLDMTVSDAFAIVRSARTASGTQRLVGCFVARRPDGQAVYARVVSSPEPDVYKKYLGEAMRGFVTLALGNSNAAAGKTGKNAGAATAEKTPEKTSARKQSTKAQEGPAYERAGAGPRPDSVLGIYLRLIPQLGYGGMVVMNYVPMVLFKDGTVFEDYDVPLPDFDVAAARKARPDSWGKWRKKNGGIEYQNNKGVWETTSWVGPLPGAKPGERLSGRFSSFTGGGNTATGGGTAYAISSSLSFYPDGRFTADQNVSMVTSGSASNAGVVANSRNGKEGTYTLSNYAITLKYNDGRVVRHTFVYMDKKGRKDAFYLSGTPYTKKD